MIKKQIKIVAALVFSIAAVSSTFAADGTYDNTEAGEINANTGNVAANAGNIARNTSDLAILNGNANQMGSVANTVSTANTYTDTREAAITTAYQSYADQAETDAVNTANTYTNTREAAITTAYQSYADQAETDAVSTANTYTNTREAAITTAYQSYADQAETDAVNTARTYTDTREVVIRTDLTANLAAEADARSAADAVLGGQISSNRRDIDRNTQGIAMVAALTHTTVLPGMTHALDVSAAHFEGETGMAVSYSRRINENVQINFGGASTGDFDDSVLRGGVGFQW